MKPKKLKSDIHVLLIGYSRIARKRIIPALEASGVNRLDIASQHSAKIAHAESCVYGKIYDSYQEALDKSNADIVYISLVNSEHFTWAEKALERKFHVIVDKPAFTSLSDALKLVEFAKKNRLMLAEANVFSFHPQIAMIHELFAKAETYPSRVSAFFSFPPLKEYDFRYKKALGGSAIYDLGPYAIASGSVFFRECPSKIFCHINKRGGADNVEIAFSMIAVYSEGRTMVGHFGFDTEYQNTITLFGPSVCVRLERVFTIPPDYANMLYVRQNNKEYQLKVPPSDTFTNFFNHAFSAFADNRIESLTDELLLNARSLDMLICSINKFKEIDK